MPRHRNGPKLCQSARSHAARVSRLLDAKPTERAAALYAKNPPGPELRGLWPKWSRREIREAFRDVLDPEVGIDIVAGLIKRYNHTWDDTVEVDLVLYLSGLPLAATSNR